MALVSSLSSARTSDASFWARLAVRGCFAAAAAQILHSTFMVLRYDNDSRYATRHATTLFEDSLLLSFGGSRGERARRSSYSSSNIIPLRELVRTKDEPSCPLGLFRVNDTISSPESAYGYEVFGSGGDRYDRNRSRHRKIPRIVHVTSRTRCMPREFVDNLEKWRFRNHSFFFHNEEAMERLLFEKEWPEFPQLRQALRCTKGGAGRADVWRALVMWEYGGIYTDIDNAPTPKFLEGNVIAADDDAFFVIERSAILSQYFFASRPRHPLFYLLVQHMMSRLLSLNDVSMQVVSVVTGPGALRTAFNNFMDGQGANFPYTKPLAKYWYPSAQMYVGMYNYTVRAVGHQDDPDEFVARDVIPDKNLIYHRMNMTYFRDIPKVESKQSCFQRIYKEERLFDKWSYLLGDGYEDGDARYSMLAYY